VSVVVVMAHRALAETAGRLPSQEVKRRLLEKPDEELSDFEKGVLGTITEHVTTKKDELEETTHAPCYKPCLILM